MPDVYQWPPVTALAYRSDFDEPMQISFGLNGAVYSSQSQPNRRIYEVEIGSVGHAGADAAYLHELKSLLRGKMPLVRVAMQPQVWWGSVSGLVGQRGVQRLGWQANSETLTWDMLWGAGATITGTAEMDGDWHAIRAAGFAPNTTIAYPGELVETYYGEQANVVAIAKSDSTGEALIRLDAELPDGSYSVGAARVLDFLITDWGGMRIGAGLTTTTISMREVLSGDTAARTYIDPWTP